MELLGNTPFFAIHLTTSGELEHRLSLNQSSQSPLALAFTRFSLVILAFCCHSLQDPREYLVHYHHLFSVHVRTIQLHFLCGPSDSFLKFQHVRQFSSGLFVDYISTHIALTKALSVLLQIAFSFSFAHHISLAYSSAGLTQ